jgi:hypothetical protein
MPTPTGWKVTIYCAIQAAAKQIPGLRALKKLCNRLARIVIQSP